MRTIEQRTTEFERSFASRELAGWRYSPPAAGTRCCSCLVALASASAGWISLSRCTPDYRTVTVDYPPTAATLAELADGVLDIMDAEGIGRAHIVGQSAGGMLAEVLTQRTPDRVASLVFSGTGLYGPEDVDRLAGKLAAIKDTPWEQTLDAARAALRAVWQHSAEADFWIMQVEAAYHRAGRDGLAKSLGMLLNLAQHSDELRVVWDGPTLMLAATDDPLITPIHRQRLLNLHPNCDLRVFPDGGHSLLVTRPTDYLAEVTQHLLKATTSA